MSQFDDDDFGGDEVTRLDDATTRSILDRTMPKRQAGTFEVANMPGTSKERPEPLEEEDLELIDELSWKDEEAVVDESPGKMEEDSLTFHSLEEMEAQMEEMEADMEESPDADAEDVDMDEVKGAMAELMSKIESLQKEVADERNAKLRFAADMENMKKRTAKNQDMAIARARAELLEAFLPVLDHLEMALQHSQDGSNMDALREGVHMVVKQFQNALAKFEIMPVDALGEKFDPTVHEAMAQEPSAEHPPGTVINQWQKGYRQGDRLIRPARVVVSSGPGETGDNKDEGAD